MCIESTSPHRYIFFNSHTEVGAFHSSIHVHRKNEPPTKLAKVVYLISPKGEMVGCPKKGALSSPTVIKSAFFASSPLRSITVSLQRCTAHAFYKAKVEFMTLRSSLKWNGVEQNFTFRWFLRCTVDQKEKRQMVDCTFSPPPFCLPGALHHFISKMHHITFLRSITWMILLIRDNSSKFIKKVYHNSIRFALNLPKRMECNFWVPPIYSFILTYAFLVPSQTVSLEAWCAVLCIKEMKWTLGHTVSLHLRCTIFSVLKSVTSWGAKVWRWWKRKRYGV